MSERPRRCVGGASGARQEHQPLFRAGQPPKREQPAQDLRMGIAVGDTVFAPKRCSNGAHRYIPSEVTGIQASARTASVSFLLDEPDAEDTIVPFYSLIPCPRSVLAEGGIGGPLPSMPAGENSMQAGAHGETGSGGKWAHFVREDRAAEDSLGAIPNTVKTTGLESAQPFTEKFNVKLERDEEDLYSVQFSPAQFENADAYYFHAFKTVGRWILGHFPPALVAQWRVVLCVFEAYSTLHRFEVYMSLRGHQLCLVDGAHHHWACAASGLWEGEARGAARRDVAEVLWLCALADDIADSRRTTELLWEWLPRGGGRFAHSGANDVSAVVVQFVGEQDAVGCTGTSLSEAGGVATVDAAGVLAEVLGGMHCMIKCRLPKHERERSAVTPAAERSCQAPLAPLKQEWRWRGSEQQVLRGMILELCIPASAWQMHAVLALSLRNEAANDNGQRTACLEGGERLPVPRGASSRVLQAIANGDVFDPHLACAATSSSEWPGLLHALRRNVVRDRNFLEEAFPILSAVRAILQDTLPHTAPAEGQPAKHVVLCLPTDAGVEKGGAVAYRSALQRFLQPWHLFWLAADERQRPGAGAVLDALSWLEAGGVLLLNPEEPLCKLSGLTEEADFIIVCGSSPRPNLACRPGAVRILLVSEIETSSKREGWHPWTRGRGQREAWEASHAECEILEKVVTATNGELQGSEAMTKAVTLLRQLGGVGPLQMRATSKQKNLDGTPWWHLRRFAADLLLHCCRAPAVTPTKWEM
ncbi:hypothetical protein TRVL_02986 [Trypanosoma vivax]|nr:hypothetical protein TRVL_02986 [Trypanosoma vivax]